MAAHEHRSSHKNQRAQSNTSSSPDVSRNICKHRVVKTSTLSIGVDCVVSSCKWQREAANPNKPGVYGQLQLFPVVFIILYIVRHVSPLSTSHYQALKI